MARGGKGRKGRKGRKRGKGGGEANDDDSPPRSVR
jgi:hypothetical protein